MKTMSGSGLARIQPIESTTVSITSTISTDGSISRSKLFRLVAAAVSSSMINAFIVGRFQNSGVPPDGRADPGRNGCSVAFRADLAGRKNSGSTIRSRS